VRELINDLEVFWAKFLRLKTAILKIQKCVSRVKRLAKTQFQKSRERTVNTSIFQVLEFTSFVSIKKESFFSNIPIQFFS